eukprot:2847231-Amphidinium_carterae.1
MTSIRTATGLRSDPDQVHFDSNQRKAQLNLMCSSKTTPHIFEPGRRMVDSIAKPVRSPHTRNRGIREAYAFLKNASTPSFRLQHSVTCRHGVRSINVTTVDYDV